MDGSAFDTVARDRTALSRRGSLRFLGWAGLMAASPASTGVARGKTKKRADERCQKNAAQCRAGVERSCNGDAGCLEGHLPCCGHFAQCRAGLGIVCLSKGAPLPAA